MKKTHRQNNHSRASLKRLSLTKDSSNAQTARIQQFGRCVQRIRHESGLSQIELAARMGQSSEWLESVESGRRRPHIRFVDELRDCVGFSSSQKRDLENQLKEIATCEITSSAHIKHATGKDARTSSSSAGRHQSERLKHLRSKKHQLLQSHERHATKPFISFENLRMPASLDELSRAILEVSTAKYDESQTDAAAAHEIPQPSAVFDQAPHTQSTENPCSQYRILEQAAQDDDFYRALGLAVKDFRKENGFTQAQLAKKLGVSRLKIRNFERGLARSFVPDLTAVAEIFSVSAIDIVERAQNKKIGNLSEYLLPES